MNQLETTIVDSARQQLSLLQHALARPISDDRNDEMSSAFWMASGYVMLANLADSGLSEAARDALMAIEKEIAMAMGKSPVSE
jgi:hypothetical protein